MITETSFFRLPDHTFSSYFIVALLKVCYFQGIELPLIIKMTLNFDGITIQYVFHLCLSAAVKPRIC